MYDSELLQHELTKPPKTATHRRGHSSPDVYFRSSKSIPRKSSTDSRVSFDPKTHRRVLSPLQYVPKHPPVPSEGSGGYALEDELVELQNNLRNTKEIHGEYHPHVALALNSIGNCYFRHGKFQLAYDSYNSALNLYKSTVGHGHIFVAITLGNIGTLHWRCGEFTDAESALEESLCLHLISAKGAEDDNAEVASALHNLGIVRYLMKDFKGSSEVLERAYKARRNLFGYEHIDVSRSIDALGSVYLELGDEDRAMKCHREALRVKHSLLGHCHASLVMTIMNIGKVHRVRGEIDRAVAVYEEALEMQKVMYPNWDSMEDVGVTVHTIGFAYALKADYLKSLELYGLAKDIYMKAGLAMSDKRISAVKENIEKMRKNISGIGRKYVF